MRRRRRTRALAAAFACSGAVVSLLGPTTPAAAAPGPPSSAPGAAAGQNEASARFAVGLDAFRRGDYRAAGQAFDAAYALAPHHDPLWNSAQAWERAQELARAANRYAEYLEVAPAQAPDRDRATAALARLSPRLGRVELHVRQGAHAAVDGEPARTAAVYVYPGTHRVTATGAEPPARDVTLRAGEVQSLSFLDEPLGQPAPAVPPATAPAPKPAATPASAQPARSDAPPETPPAEKRGLPPWVVYVGGAATVAVAGFTVWSGFDTVGATHDFRSTPNQVTLDNARAAEVRTNVAIAVAAGLGVATAACAIFFVQWQGAASRVDARVSPLGATLAVHY